MKSLNNTISFWHRSSELFNQEQMLRLVVTLSFTTVLCIVFLSINRGIGFADESWYLVLLRDHVAINSSAWPLFFSWLPNDIVVIRTVTVGLYILGSLFFGYGMYSYFKVRFNLSKASIFLLSMIAFIGAFCFSNAICLVPNYVASNHFIFASSIGFSLLSAKNGKTGIWWAWLSGFFIGFLAFIMPSNIPIIFFVVLFIIVTQNPQQRLIGFTLGVACSFFAFSLLIEPLPEYYLMIKQSLIPKTGFSSRHGIKQIITWTIKALQYIVTNIAIITALIYFLRRQVDESNINREPLLLGIFLLIIVYFAFPYAIGFTKGIEHGIYPAEILAALFGWFILETRHKLTLQEGCALTILLVSPILACLGTDVPFSIRGTIYIGTFYGAAGLLFVLSPFCARFRIYMCLALGVLTLGFVNNFFKPNWSTQETLSENITPLSQIPIHHRIQVTPDVAAIMSDAKHFVGSSKHVVGSDVLSWVFVFLLDLRPLTYEWKPTEPQIIKAIEESTVNEIVCIEQNGKLFSESFWSEIKAKWTIKSVHDLDGQFKFYRLSRIS